MGSPVNLFSFASDSYSQTSIGGGVNLLAPNLVKKNSEL